MITVIGRVGDVQWDIILISMKPVDKSNAARGASSSLRWQGEPAELVFRQFNDPQTLSLGTTDANRMFEFAAVR